MNFRLINVIKGHCSIIMIFMKNRKVLFNSVLSLNWLIEYLKIVVNFVHIINVIKAFWNLIWQIFYKIYIQNLIICGQLSLAHISLFINSFIVNYNHASEKHVNNVTINEWMLHDKSVIIKLIWNVFWIMCVVCVWQCNKRPRVR